MMILHSNGGIMVVFNRFFNKVKNLIFLDKKKERLRLFCAYLCPSIYECGSVLLREANV